MEKKMNSFISELFGIDDPKSLLGTKDDSKSIEGIINDSKSTIKFRIDKKDISVSDSAIVYSFAQILALNYWKRGDILESATDIKLSKQYMELAKMAGSYSAYSREGSMIKNINTQFTADNIKQSRSLREEYKEKFSMLSERIGYIPKKKANTWDEIKNHYYTHIVPLEK